MGTKRIEKGAPEFSYCCIAEYDSQVRRPPPQCMGHLRLDVLPWVRLLLLLLLLLLLASASATAAGKDLHLRQLVKTPAKKENRLSKSHEISWIVFFCMP